MSEARAKVTLAGGVTIELDGTEAFVTSQLEKFGESIRAGVAGIHIEDQLYPKRAHYHKYVAHAVAREEFVDKIKFACRARAESDRDFVIIARSDT